MFSVVVAGRLPLPAPQQIDETHAIFPLDDAASINHVTVFMTGQQAFPPGVAATVHLNWKASTEDRWLMLGCLKNEKPSAIFRIKGLTQQNTSSASVMGIGMGMGSEAVNAATNSAAIGISIEPVASVDEQMAALTTRSGAVGTDSHGGSGGGGGGGGADLDGMQTEDGGGSNDSLALVRPGQLDPVMQTNMALALAPKIASNIFSYLSSFAPDSAPQTVPLLKRWLEQFERKLKAQGIGFLARADAE